MWWREAHRATRWAPRAFTSWTYCRMPGTHDTRLIGRRSSNGCIGLYNEHIEELYRWRRSARRCCLFDKTTATSEQNELLQLLFGTSAGYTSCMRIVLGACRRL